MSRQTKLPFGRPTTAADKHTDSKSTERKDARDTLAPDSTSAAVSELANDRKRRTSTQVEELERLFGTSNDSHANDASSSATTASASSGSARESVGTILDARVIRRAYHARREDMQKTIDDLVEASGRHPELHSAYGAQVAADSGAVAPSAQAATSVKESSSSSSSTPKKARVSTLRFSQVRGDLFSCPPQAALVHCVSTCLAMGKGIATEFKKRFGGVADLKAQKKDVGDVAVLQRSGRFVYYLITKPRYFHKPSYDSLEASLVSMRAHIIAHEVREVCMPRIGCGLDGLLWPKVAELIQKVFRDVDVAITVYTV